ncbi:von Willebrand factor A domain-containing protein 7 isoform X2 [Kryptolebias marmoratus]|nr:von Willebrand factor A domain-containing protein 7 isoform X2 [Kryptolebias marmoratus]
MFGLTALSLVLLECGAHGFSILPSKSLTHQEITERAILNIMVRVCRTLALAEGRNFAFPSQPFTAESVVAACNAPKSSKSFHRSITKIRTSNWVTDVRHFFTPSFHFDDETFVEGRTLITEGLFTIKAANKKRNYFQAMLKLGEISHTLQDFYSHSNWVEMGNKLPNSNLIRANTRIGNIAEQSRATCLNCDGDDCSNNILDDILQEKILTSGYFRLFLPSKPKGKCSHGGFLDATHNTEPKGGINKDTLTSEHGHLHSQAANIAVAATSELLEDVRGAAGDRDFLQMMGISRGSSKALCFVVDTRSTGEETEAVKMVISSIINRKVRALDEPSSYLLVSFSDLSFGPLMRTTDPKEFKAYINSLSATGGDSPKNTLSGLQLALIGTPANTEIFVFTGTAVKDAHMKTTVTALIEQTQSVVNFMITNTLGFQTQADSSKQQYVEMSKSDPQLYRDLAQASGGQVIEITEDRLLEATSVITESSRSSLVTLLQAARSPGKAESFTFEVDESVTNLAVYITGTSVDVTLIDPSGVLHNNMMPQSSIISSQLVGNFQTLWLQTQVGMWEIRIASTNPYNLKVVGESPLDFLFNFVKELQGPPGGFDLIDNRPTAGRSASLMVTLTGGDSATLTEVTLVEPTGSGQINGSVEAQGGGEYIVRFDRIPSFQFVVFVKGQKNDSTSGASLGIFQRQSTTSQRASSLTVAAGHSNCVLEPGTTQSVPFSVLTFREGGNFTIQATSDQDFTLTFPPSLSMDTGGSANGIVNITVPATTPSGTGVTLIIEAVAPGGADTNYAVLRFTILQKVTDFTQPVCQLHNLQSSCSDDCSQAMWELSVLVTDGADGTGVDHISLRQGSGTLKTTSAVHNESITLVSYMASCCSPDVQLVAVDQVGNVEICSYSAHKTTELPTSFSTRTLQSLLFCFCITVLGLSLLSEMEIN